MQAAPVHDSGGGNDKLFVSPFLKHAEEIFIAARQGGTEDCDLAILVHRDGSIHMVSDSGWGLEPLRLHHGAVAAYSVRRHDGQVRLEARTAGQCCFLRTQGSSPPLSGVPELPPYLMVQ